MPELPEVETVRNTLKTLILGRKIVDVVAPYSRIIENDFDEFKSKVIGQEFLDIKRVGKYLVFCLNDYYLISHLRMEGKYYVLKDYEVNKHMHVFFKLDDGYTLIYHDVRKFGRMELIDKSEDYVKHIGIGLEPFDENFTVQYLRSKLKNQAIKTWLLDQNNVAGLGNIYVDEVLFASGIHPEKKANTLTDKNLEDIITNSRRILTAAIEAGGTTIRSYTSSLGVTGMFQLNLKVHQKAGQPCPNCGTIIKKIKVNGRGTYLCEKCNHL